jgi:hypothetical protein
VPNVIQVTNSIPIIGEVYAMQNYVIKRVVGLYQGSVSSCFLQPSKLTVPDKTDC